MAKGPSVDEVFGEAIRRSPGEDRSAYLDKVCGKDAALRHRVEQLLRAAAEAGSFLESPAEDPTSTVFQSIPEKPGSEIGPYKLLEQIGEGGMGVVYMAEQTEPVNRRVAVKIIKPGMDSLQVIARFEAERQALAMMDHPNIAKVLDAGTTDSGRPYFVMELVNGIPVTQFCDEQQLTTRERLDLFIPICLAVQHAHQKGIIHRDIKPSNILVALYDDCPVPKVIDFGVAKAISHRLTEKTMFTSLGQILGTIEYMSPEQAQRNQLDIDTRSDVYSLGVVLYELLTGETPFDKSRLRSVAIDELLRILREEDPPKPSTRLSSSNKLPAVARNRKIEPSKLRSLVCGELDWIVMKALEKNRPRRYETANAFLSDIRNYLTDEPVTACPPSRAYRFQKFARRNKAAFVTASIVAVALLLGIAGTVWQAIQVSNELDRTVHLFEAERRSRVVQRESGWREQARKELLLACDIRADEQTAEVFTRTLSGVDAKISQKWKLSTGRIALDHDDAHLVLSLPGGGAQVVELATGKKTLLIGQETATAMGPVGFDMSGRSLQAVCTSLTGFNVSRFGTNQDQVTLKLPTELIAGELHTRYSESSSDEQSTIREQLEKMAQATPDLKRMVVWHGIPNTLLESENSEGIVVLWDANMGELIHSARAEASALAIAPDGSFYAIGEKNGFVTVRAPGSDEPLATIRTGLTGVTAIAIGRDPRKRPGNRGGVQSEWLLAAADEASTVTVWDLESSLSVNTIRGILHSINTIKFSKGSLMLAVAGHRSTQLWDTFGLGHILNLKHASDRQDIVWSSDDSMIVTSGLGSKEFEEAQIWQIEAARGIKTLRGMSAAGSKVVFSSDSRQLAAVANDWTIGIWDIYTGQLTQRLQARRGFSIDNCALRFSRDGSTFYFSAGRTMTQWDLATGAKVKEWSLPPGLQDQIGITKDGRVLLMRYDRRSPSRSDELTHDCRLRHMTNEERSLKEWGDFTGRIFSIVGTRDGNYFAMDGETASEDRFTMLINGHTGQRLADVKGTFKNDSAMLTIADDADLLMQFVQHAKDDSLSSLFRLADGKKIGRLPFWCNALSPDGHLGLHTGSDSPWCDLYDISKETKLSRFQLSSVPSDYVPNFSPNGGYVAWASMDGTVSVCDLQQVRKELEMVDASW